MIEMPTGLVKYIVGHDFGFNGSKMGNFYFNDNMSVYRIRFDNGSVSSMLNRKDTFRFVKILEYYNIETDFVYFKELHNEINTGYYL